MEIPLSTKDKKKKRLIRVIGISNEPLQRIKPIKGFTVEQKDNLIIYFKNSHE